MNFENKNYRVVVIDYPVFVLDDQRCATVLGKTLQMKNLGYRSTYGENVLPMDKTDFFSTHIILCEEKKDELIPILAYKATPYDGHPSCVDKIHEILSSIKDPSNISFDSSWAQNLEYRFSGDSNLKNELREITMMLIVKHHEEFNLAHMMTCGVVKVKTDQFFLKIGLDKLNENALFKQKSINNEDVVIFYNNSFSYEAVNMAKKHKNLWENKLMISGLGFIKEIKRAA
jgi:hypothetical protein